MELMKFISTKDTALRALSGAPLPNELEVFEKVGSPPEREQPVVLEVEEEEPQQQIPELSEELLIETEHHEVVQEETENIIQVSPIKADSRAEQSAEEEPEEEPGTMEMQQPSGSASMSHFGIDDDEDPFATDEFELLMNVRRSHSDILLKSTKTYRCNVCPFVTDDKLILAYHMDRHKLTGGHMKCTVCSYRCHTPEALVDHLDLHSQANPQAVASLNRKRKLRRSSPERPSQHEHLIKCKKCVYQTASAERYKTHCLEHALRIQRRLETLIRRKNANGDTRDKKTKSRMTHRFDTQHHCWKCSFHCDAEAVLENHMELHGLNVPFKCSMCDYSSYSRQVVQFHEPNHHVDRSLTSILLKKKQQPSVITIPCPVKKREMDLCCNRCPTMVHNFNEFVKHCETVHGDNMKNKTRNNTTPGEKQAADTADKTGNNTTPEQKPATDTDTDKGCENDQGLSDLPHDLDLNTVHNVDTVVIDVIGAKGSDDVVMSRVV